MEITETQKKISETIDALKVTITKEKVDEMLDSMKDLLLYKNQNYGNSAMQPLRIFQKADISPDEILSIRLDEKLSRIKTADEIRVNDLCDTIGYSVLKLIQLGTTSKDIEVLKD